MFLISQMKCPLMHTDSSFLSQGVENVGENKPTKNDSKQAKNTNAPERGPQAPHHHGVRHGGPGGGKAARQRAIARGEDLTRVSHF